MYAFNSCIFKNSICGFSTVTGIAGVATGVSGIVEIQEGFTGNNFMRDGVFGGNQTAYNWYSFVTDAVATDGSIWCGGWLTYNQPRIQAYNNIQNCNYSNTIANKGYLDVNSAAYSSYTQSLITQQEIIKYGKMVKEASGTVTFLHSGLALGYSTMAMWELTVRPDLWLIVHFL